MHIFFMQIFFRLRDLVERSGLAHSPGTALALSRSQGSIKVHHEDGAPRNKPDIKKG